MSTLDKITQVVEAAKAKFSTTYYSDQYTFNNDYIESASGLKRDVEKLELVYPIQFEVEGDFYFFQSESDLVLYVVGVLTEAGMVSNDDEYYDSSEYEDSGC